MPTPRKTNPVPEGRRVEVFRRAYIIGPDQSVTLEYSSTCHTAGDNFGTKRICYRRLKPDAPLAAKILRYAKLPKIRKSAEIPNF